MLADAIKQALAADNSKPLVLQHFVNGSYVSGSSFIDSVNPATGEVWAKVPEASEEIVNNAVAAAKQAFKHWSKTSAKERSRIMNATADIVEKYLDEFAQLESRDQGKPVWLAKAVDIPRCILNFRFFAGLMAYDTNSSTVLNEPYALNYVTRKPVGVAGLISPWNLPLYLLSFKVAPAIAVGNCIVAKPSELTSVTAWLLSHAFIEAGLPAGIVNIVFGSGAGAGNLLVQHPDVPLISFTGSTVTGEKITRSSAPFHKKLSLEMGGKNAAIIFDDADLSKCIPDTVWSSFANQGEVCLCTSRIYVHRKVYDTFLQEFVKQSKEYTVGPPSSPNRYKLGALISSDHLQKVNRYIKIAEAEATILCGKEPMDLPEQHTNGYFLRPHVITHVSDTSKLMTDEIFGPVTCVVPFDTEDEVIERVNSNQYGLCATVWSENAKRLHRISQALEVGTVWCNCWLVRDLNMPFGGMKASGIGREGAKESFEFFTEQRTICIKIA